MLMVIIQHLSSNQPHWWLRRRKPHDTLPSGMKWKRWFGVSVTVLQMHANTFTVVLFMLTKLRRHAFCRILQNVQFSEILQHLRRVRTLVKYLGIWVAGCT